MRTGSRKKAFRDEGFLLQKHLGSAYFGSTLLRDLVLATACRVCTSNLHNVQKRISITMALLQRTFTSIVGRKCRPDSMVHPLEVLTFSSSSIRDA